MARRTTTPEQELEECQAAIDEAKRLRMDATLAEAGGADPAKTEPIWRRAAEQEVAARDRIAQLEAVIKARDAGANAERARRKREHGLIQDAVRSALSGSRFIAISRLDESLWPQAWELYQSELADWLQRRRAEAASEEGQIPAAAKNSIRSAEFLLARSVPDLCAETAARRKALIEA